jgi:hypothetical protein
MHIQAHDDLGLQVKRPNGGEQGLGFGFLVAAAIEQPLWGVKLALRYGLLQWAVPVSGDQQKRLREEAL